MKQQPLNLIFNPNMVPIPAQKETKLIRIFNRLRALPSGKNYVKTEQLRRIFGVNGTFYIPAIQAVLSDLRRYNLLKWENISRGDYMGFTIHLNYMPEEVDAFLDDQRKVSRKEFENTNMLLGYFLDGQERRTGTRPAITGVMGKLAKILFNDRGIDVCKRAIDEYWALRSDLILKADFKEFYNRFDEMLMRVQVDIEDEQAREREKSRTKLTRLERARQELALALKENNKLRISIWTEVLEEEEAKLGKE